MLSSDHIPLLFADLPKLTSLDPSFPAVKVVPGLVPTYQVPLGFKGVVFHCNAAAWPPVVIQWSSSRSTDRTFSNQISMGNSTFVSAQLRFHDGFTLHDTAKYTCTVQETVSGVSVSVNITLVPSSAEIESISVTSCSLDSTTAYFQIQATDKDCETWRNYRSEVENNVYDIFAGGISAQCRSCVINRTILVTSPPKCSDGVVIFKGTVTTSLKNHTTSIFCALYTWQQLGPTIIVGDKLMRVIQSCNFYLNSLDMAKRCSLANPIDVPVNAIVASVAGVMGLLLLLAAIVLISKERRYV